MNSHLSKLFALLAIWSLSFGTSCHRSESEKPTGPEAAQAVETSWQGPLRKAVFLPYWVTSAQFAGYYVGLEKGIFKKYGIDLQITPFQPFGTPRDLMKSGQVDFAALWLVNAMDLRDEGVDLVNIAQPSTRSSLMLLTKKKSGIARLEQMDGKKAGIWNGFELQPRALFQKYGLDVKIIPIGSTNNLFLMDGVDITVANWFDEYHSILNSGFHPEDLNTFFFADYGLNFLEDGIYCLSSTRKNKPELCRDFIKATFEGWLYAFDHPDEAVDIVVKYATQLKIPVNRVHQKWMLDRYRDLYFDKRKPINTQLAEKDFDAVGKVLKESGLIKVIPEYREFFQPISLADTLKKAN